MFQSRPVGGSKHSWWFANKVDQEENLCLPVPSDLRAPARNICFGDATVNKGKKTNKQPIQTFKYTFNQFPVQDLVVGSETLCF